MEQTLSAEVTLRLEGDLLMAIDKIAKSSGISSRSAAIEKILQVWYETRLQHKIDRGTVEYYESLAPEEIEEDRVWAEFASEQAIERWDM